MKLEELRRPQRVEIDLRLPLLGGGIGLVLLCGWLLLGQSGGSGELLPLPATPRAAGAELTQTAAELPAQGKSSPNKAVQAKAPQTVHSAQDPFFARPQAVSGAGAGTRPAQAPAATPRQLPELRLAGIISADSGRLALISCGTGDFCLAEGQSRAGLTVLELGDDYAVVQTADGTSSLQLAGAAGGGRSRATKTETRSERRSRTAAEHQRR